MKDFTLAAYSEYLRAIESSFESILRFDEYFLSKPKPESFCIIRHDVDRKPENALWMAKLENNREIKATYFFRARRHTFKQAIIREITSLGHEIGYHYESLSDANGDMTLALKSFEKNLKRFSEIAPIKSVSMHGRPFSSFDNRDLWKDRNNREKLVELFGILGEVYLDIDYTDILYITDTGRNWSTTNSNIRDVVHSNIEKNFSSGLELLTYLGNSPHNRLVLTIHPERWTDSKAKYILQWLIDFSLNGLKKLV